jgi:hypothetical protein
MLWRLSPHTTQQCIAGSMPRIYDRTADDAFRSQDAIESDFLEGDDREVKRHIDVLYRAASEFETLASDWKELAEQYENVMMDEGRL